MLVAGIGVASGVLVADASDFLPRPTRNGAYLDLFASHERDENAGGVRSFGWNDTFFKEKLTLYSSGFFYHPRFLQYQASIATALKQEAPEHGDYRNSSTHVARIAQESEAAVVPQTRANGSRDWRG